MSKYIEGVTASCFYSDFLQWCLPVNKMVFDNLVVASHPDDKETVRVCSYYGVKCHLTESFYDKEGNFRKFYGLNEGLQQLSKKGWVCIHDSDIYLPPVTRKLLQELDLDEWKLYSADRILLNSFEEFIDYQINRNLLVDNWLLNLTDFKLGARLTQVYGTHWQALGYFQLFNPSVSGITEYDRVCLGAEHCDVAFSQRWPRKHRVFLPEIICIHLDSQQSESGLNWSGRKSKPFKLENSYK